MSSSQAVDPDLLMDLVKIQFRFFGFKVNKLDIIK